MCHALYIYQHGEKLWSVWPHRRRTFWLCHISCRQVWRGLSRVSTCRQSLVPCRVMSEWHPKLDVGPRGWTICTRCSMTTASSPTEAVHWSQREAIPMVCRHHWDDDDAPAKYAMHRPILWSGVTTVTTSEWNFCFCTISCHMLTVHYLHGNILAAFLGIVAIWAYKGNHPFGEQSFGRYCFGHFQQEWMDKQ